MKEKLNYGYSKKEERLNVITHGFGLLASVIAFPFLVKKSFQFIDFWQSVSFIIYGCSLLILYAASTFYHASKNPIARRKLNILDHSAIYVLIAGTYTPFTLVSLEGKTGWLVFVFTWIFAIVGIVLKLFFTGKFDKLSTAMYLLMGWQVIFVIEPLMNSLPEKGIQYLFYGGVSYTIGAILYSVKKVPFNHVIFHVFVLLGSLFHFLAVFNYV